MKYTQEEVLEFITQEDVKFIRLAFADPHGAQKNIAILPGELERAFTKGIPFDASAIPGFSGAARGDLFLYPLPETLTVLPWRSMQGKVVRMFSEIRTAAGDSFALDSRRILARAAQKARERGLTVEIGSQIEFYLFKTDDQGNPTQIPLDTAGYLDVAPEDKGENVRREICQTLSQMGITPESSHHEAGPGQNKIVFRHSGALEAGDHVLNYMTVVKAIAGKNGLYADFSPRPFLSKPGFAQSFPAPKANLFRIALSVTSDDGADRTESFAAGILSHFAEISHYLDPESRFAPTPGSGAMPTPIVWSRESRTTPMRLPNSHRANRLIEIQSVDATGNPYITFALLIHAGLDGVEKGLALGRPVEETDIGEAGTPAGGASGAAGTENASPGSCPVIPLFSKAKELTRNSPFITSVLPEALLPAAPAKTKPQSL